MITANLLFPIMESEGEINPQLSNNHIYIIYPNIHIYRHIHINTHA